MVASPQPVTTARVFRGPSCRTELRRAGIAQSLPQATLSVRGLGLARGGRWLFRDLTLDVLRGRFTALVGPSGVGKSSLLACLAGMLAPSDGSIEYRCNESCIHPPQQFQNRIGIVFQELMLTPRSSLLENVLCGRLGRYPWWRTAVNFPLQDQQEAFALLDRLGISQYARRWAAEVSGGEQQRTAIARALFQQPEVFLADEPVSHLDAANTDLVLTLLRRQAHEEGRTVVCVLHNAELVERFADTELRLDAADPRAWSVRSLR